LLQSEEAVAQRKMRLLFVCTKNSARSQMAEGFARALGKGRVESFSAGTHPTSVHPLAIKVMAELGIDISGQTSKPLDMFLDQTFAYVICVCDRAAKECPAWPRARELARWSFEDPAAVRGTEAERLAAFRKVRNEIQQRINLALLAAKIHTKMPTKPARGAAPTPSQLTAGWEPGA
jgi:arsenate reductase